MGDAEEEIECFGHFRLKPAEKKRSLVPYLFHPKIKSNGSQATDDRSADPPPVTLPETAVGVDVSQAVEESINVSEQCRVGKSFWCDCGNCCAMTREVDCFCCRESAPARALLADGMQCITA